MGGLISENQSYENNFYEFFSFHTDGLSLARLKRKLVETRVKMIN